MEFQALSLIFIPMVMAILIYAVDRDTFSRSVFVLQGVLTVLWLFLLKGALPALQAGAAVQFVIGGWSRLAGIELKIDTVSLLFTLMTVIAFWYVYLYAWWSRRSDHKFLFFLSMLQGALTALFLVNDLFSIFVLIEFVTITCSILITYKKDGLSVKAGLYYLLYNSLAMLLFLLGIMMLYMLAGTLNLTLLAETVPHLSGNPAYRWAVALLVAAFCLKSALVPVYSWLPLAHASAPACVSALLSGLVVKTGLFILLRLGTVMLIPGVPALLLGLGLVSGLFGAAMAFIQTDIKRILAYHTISQVGLIVVGLSSQASLAETGALLHIFNHFLFKSLLFLCAGAIITMTGERHVGRLRGIWRQSPVLGAAMAVGMLGITGAPFFNGSLSKGMIGLAFGGGTIGFLLLLINFGTVLSFLKLSVVLTGRGDMPLSYPDPRIVAIILTALLVLVSYPAERALLAAVGLGEPVRVIGTGKAFAKFLFMGGGALWIYRAFYLPNRERLKLLTTARTRFSRGVGVLMIFLAALSLYLL